MILGSDVVKDLYLSANCLLVSSWF